MVGNGLQKRDFVHVDDVVSVNIAATQNISPEYFGQVFNVGSGENISILEIAKLISDNYIHIPARSGEAETTLVGYHKSEICTKLETKRRDKRMDSNSLMDKNKSIYKLNGFPTIYYNNLDDDVAKREYMESQFAYWEITNYHRTSGYDGRKSDLSEILVGKYPDQMNSRDVGSATSHMKSIKTWLENSDESEKAMVVMEDDCDLSTVKYWSICLERFHFEDAA